MKSSRPKHLHPLLGRRLLDWVVDRLRRSRRPVSSSSSRRRARRSLRNRSLPPSARRATRAARHGRCGRRGARVPRRVRRRRARRRRRRALTSGVLEDLLASHRREEPATVLSVEPDGPRPYGRILRDEKGEVSAIVEEQDATPTSWRSPSSTRLRTSLPQDLWRALGRLDSSNAQGELYLTDAVGHLVADGRRAAVYRAPDPAR